MVINSRLLYADDGSYMVLTDEFKPGVTFIAHVEGNPRMIYKLWKAHLNEFGDKVWFCLKDIDYFKNHCVEVEDGIYEYTREA